MDPTSSEVRHVGLAELDFVLRGPSQEILESDGSEVLQFFKILELCPTVLELTSVRWYPIFVRGAMNRLGKCAPDGGYDLFVLLRVLGNGLHPFETLDMKFQMTRG